MTEFAFCREGVGFLLPAEELPAYRTYLDFSELTPPLVYSVALAFFGLGAVFVTLGLLAAACGFVTWLYLPKSL